MAINPSSEPQFQGQTNPPDGKYPHGSARNDATPGDLSGTPFVANLTNDLLGFFQSTLVRNGETPNGDPDSVTNPQILNALIELAAPVTVPVSGQSYEINGQGDTAEYVPPAGATEVTYRIRVENADPTSLSRLGTYSCTPNGAILATEQHDQYGLAFFGVSTTHTTKLVRSGLDVADRCRFINNGTSGQAATLVRVDIKSYTIPKGLM